MLTTLFSSYLQLAKAPASVRLVAFLLTLIVLWLPLAAPIYLTVSDPNWVSILTMVVLYVEFIVLWRFWGRQIYQEPQVLAQHGLVWTRQNGWEWLQGWLIGQVSLFALFGLQGALGWVQWSNPTVALVRIALEGLLISAAVGFAEELFFRGWLLGELQRDYGPKTVLWATSLIFALLHFIKPLPDALRSLPQFGGLLILGLALVWAKRSGQGRLGLPMGLHGGLVGGYYIVNVGQLVSYSGVVPEWITGINHNPLAGLLGVVFLGGIAGAFRGRSRHA